MKKTILILTFLSLIICILSCEKDDAIENDFYATNYRIGLWVNSEKNDTLDFISSTKLIRKGSVYKYEEYLYRIEGENLFISDLNSTTETQHAILKKNGDNVLLQNMYLSVGFNNNTGTFIKKAKE